MRVSPGPLLVGLGAGLLAGVLGIGGGILLVPGLVLVGMDQRTAHGTSLGATVPITAAALIGHIASGHVAYADGALLFVGAFFGVQAGAILLDRLSVQVLRIGFSVLLLVTAVRLFFPVADTAGREPIDVGVALGLVAVGLFAGLVAGLMGVGGGIIYVPAMILLFGFVNVVARATSLLVILPTAVVGSWRNRSLGNIDVRAAAIVGVGGVVSALVGSLVADDVSPRLANALFGVLLVVSAVRTLWTVFEDR